MTTKRLLFLNVLSFKLHTKIIIQNKLIIKITLKKCVIKGILLNLEKHIELLILVVLLRRNFIFH